MKHSGDITTHKPRSRDEILAAIECYSVQRIGDSAIAVENFHESQIAANHAELEVLLDCRDSLHELCVIMSRNESNTEAVAMRAEVMIPEAMRAEPPIVEVRESYKASEVNELLAGGWTLLGTTGGAGRVYYALGRRAAA